MATRFEIVLHGENPVALRAAGEEALDEIDRIEAQLSLYRSGSEVARLNAEAHQHPVRVTPSLFHLIERARELSRETSGAFDITIAPLVRCWGFMGGTGSMPEPAAIAAAQACVGMQHIELDAEKFAVRFMHPGVMLDFGAIGKGYAIDRAVEILREGGVASALIHGGTSTAFALGTQPDGARWKIAVRSPTDDAKPLAAIELENESLSVSAIRGRSFRVGETEYGHIIDPRTGAPVDHTLLSAVVLPSATETDALSTALLADSHMLQSLPSQRPKIRCLIACRTEGVPQIRVHGLDIG